MVVDVSRYFFNPLVLVAFVDECAGTTVHPLFFRSDTDAGATRGADLAFTHRTNAASIIRRCADGDRFSDTAVGDHRIVHAVSIGGVGVAQIRALSAIAVV